MPSLALDRQGNMLLGFSTANGATNPKITWAGRLSSDPVNTLGQTDTDVIAGTGHQTGSSITRWGDYSAMSLDPNDGCTFWFTTEYYNTNDLNYLTRIASTKYPGCTTVSPGSVSGTVTSGANPVGGATVTLGSRSTTTIANGTYSFANIPVGTYPSITATAAGKTSATNANVVVPGGSSSTQNFSLTAQPLSACPVDTTQADFSQGVASTVDMTTSAGDVKLSRQNLDQFNVSVGTSGFGINTTGWEAQTFTPTVSGQLTRADFGMFCSGCTGTTPNLTLSVRNTSGGLPTGADLATATITGFAPGTTIFYQAVFASPATLTAGTKYALVVRPTAAPSAGTYAVTRTGSTSFGENMYAGGDGAVSSDSGGTWVLNATGGTPTDFGFRTFITAPSGTLISSAKDTNPPFGSTPTWSTLSWTATTPANTTLQFQVAGSSNVNGPFNFVGPDGTAGTFFTTSPGAISTQLLGKRFMKYKAFLSSTDPTVTPTLNDVTVCFQNTVPTAAGVVVAGRVLASDGSGVRGALVSLTDIHGIQRTAVTNAFGYYTFDSVQSGASYVMRASARRYTFSPKTVNVSDSLGDVDFVDGQ